jgi:surfeit locus 1 family protein
VSVVGHFRHQDERRLFASNGGETGWHIYTPLETQGGKILFVNRGFVPDALKEPASRAAGQIEGEVTVRGLIRKPGVQGSFEPDADQGRNIWYWRDLAGMTASLAAADQKRVLPFFVDALAEPENPGGWPKGGATRLEIPNRHLEYALTWFGLAGALLAVFAAFAWTRLRAAA